MYKPRYQLHSFLAIPYGSRILSQFHVFRQTSKKGKRSLIFIHNLGVVQELRGNVA